jgi:hypothetical protein
MDKTKTGIKYILSIKILPEIFIVTAVALAIALSVGLVLNRADNAAIEVDSANDSVHDVIRETLSSQDYRLTIPENEDQRGLVEGRVFEAQPNTHEEHKHLSDIELAEVIKTTLLARLLSQNIIVTIKTGSDSPPVEPTAAILVILEHTTGLIFEQMLWIYEIVVQNVPGISIENINIFDNNLNHYDYSFFGFKEGVYLFEQREQRKIEHARIMVSIVNLISLAEGTVFKRICDEDGDCWFEDSSVHCSCASTVMLVDERISLTQSQFEDVKDALSASHPAIQFISFHDHESLADIIFMRLPNNIAVRIIISEDE